MSVTFKEMNDEQKGGYELLKKVVAFKSKEMKELGQVCPRVNLYNPTLVETAFKALQFGEMDAINGICEKWDGSPVIRNGVIAYLASKGVEVETPKTAKKPVEPLKTPAVETSDVETGKFDLIRVNTLTDENYSLIMGVKVVEGTEFVDFLGRQKDIHEAEACADRQAKQYGCSVEYQRDGEVVEKPTKPVVEKQVKPIEVQASPVVKPSPVETPVKNVASELSDAIASILAKNSHSDNSELIAMIAKLQEQVNALENKSPTVSEDMVRDLVQKEVEKGAYKKITVEIGEVKKEFDCKLHYKFDEVVKYVGAKIPVYLKGEAGSGKNVLCRQIADALGLTFYYQGQVTDVFDLKGFKDANGNYQETEFYRAFKNGGLLMLDELDASIPEALLTINAAIANGYFTFPCGRVEAHKDFRVVAAGNTYGTGADYQYTGRNVIDAATLDRFVMIEIDYDTEVEMSIAEGNSELVEFVDTLRTVAKKHGTQMTVSYRAIEHITTMEKLLDEKVTIESVLKSCLFKGMTLDDMNTLIEDLPYSNKYTKVFNSIKDAMVA